jgi:hypothetical protein
MPVHEQMQAHFDAIVAIRDAVIDGNLDGARTKAHWIIENKTEPAVPSWHECQLAAQCTRSGKRRASFRPRPGIRARRRTVDS